MYKFNDWISQYSNISICTLRCEKVKHNKQFLDQHTFMDELKYYFLQQNLSPVLC